MRWLAIVVLLLGVPTPVLAKPKPKVAVAPLDDDTGDKVGRIVEDVAADHAKVIGLEKTRKAIDELSITLDKKGIKKLRVKLEVEVVIHGSVEKDGGKRKLQLELTGHGKTKATLELTIKTPKALRAALAKTLANKIDDVAGTVPTPGDEGDDDDDDNKPKPVADEDKPKKLDTDDDKPKRVADEDKPKKHADEDRPKKRVAAGDDDGTSVRKRAGDDDDDTPTRHRHHHHHEGVVEQRDVATQGWMLVDAGVEVARRTLRWTVNGTEPPPPWVGTAGAAGMIGGEIYPLAQDSPGGLGGIGIYGEYARTVGLSIAVPGGTTTSTITDGHYEAGLRYRIAFGTSSVAFGAGLWKRYFVADRSALMAGATLDMPDVDYTAVAPNAIFRFAATSAIAGYAQAEAPLVLDSGGIGSGTSYGRGTVLAFDVQAGLQFLIADHYAIDVGAGYDQVGISFEAASGSMAASRGVTASTDKSYGASASLAVVY